MERFAVITGGSRGLGAHLVQRFWLEGFNLIVISRNESDLNLVIDGLPRREDQIAKALVCDLANIVQIDTLIASIKNIVTHLDVLVNNAATQGPIGEFCDNDLSAWKHTLQVNLFAPVALCQGLIPLMKTQKGASIINLSGGGATGPRPNFSAYATAKAGLVRFSETIADELKGDGIRVNCIAPGAMNTAMLREVLEKMDAAGNREIALASKVLEEGGSSMDLVADLAIFLATDASKGISGKLISAVWDKWKDWPQYLNEISQSNAYTLRRITGRDCGFEWGDK